MFRKRLMIFSPDFINDSIGLRDFGTKKKLKTLIYVYKKLSN